MEIKYLVDCPEALATVARWAHAERGHQNAGHSIQEVEQFFRRRMNRDEPPITVVAVDNAEVVGMATLKVKELEHYPQYEFWLGSVYVSEDHRRKGIGAKLVERVAEIAEGLGLGEIYLHTSLNEEWYQKLGWQVFERIADPGRTSVIMKRRTAG